RGLIVTGAQTCALPISPHGVLAGEVALGERAADQGDRRAPAPVAGREAAPGLPRDAQDLEVARQHREGDLRRRRASRRGPAVDRSEEHTSELQSRSDLV